MLAAICLMALSQAPAAAQDSRTARFVTREVTAPSVDVSPDGRTLVFDLLGDLYTLPVAGGTAVALTRGTASNSQPHFTPDGRFVVFVSDRDGASNIWVLDLRTHRLRPITRGPGWAYLDPVVTPDGQNVIVAAAPRNTWGAYDLFQIPFIGDIRERSHRRRFISAASLAPTSAPCLPGAPWFAFKCAPSSRLEPAIATEAHAVFFIAGPHPRLNGAPWHISAVDLEGDSLPIRVALPYDSGATVRRLRPVVSRDGRYLVYKCWRDTLVQWRWLDLQTGTDSALLPAELSKPAVSLAGPETGADLAQSASFSPVDHSVVLGYRGGLWQVDVPSGRRTRIPFVARVDRTLAPLARYQHHINEGPVVARQILDARPSPDGHLLAFSALNRVYVMKLPRGTPHRVSDDSVSEFLPAWSPDSHELAYVTWNDAVGGEVRRVPIVSSGMPRGRPAAIDAPRGIYCALSYTTAGTRLIAAYTNRRHAVAWNNGYFKVRDTSTADPDSIALVSIDLEDHAVAVHRVFTRSSRDGPSQISELNGQYYVAERGRLVRWHDDSAASELVVDEIGTDAQVAVSHDHRRALVSDQGGVIVIDSLGEGRGAITLNYGTASELPEMRLRRIDSTQGDGLGWFAHDDRIYYTRGSMLFIVDLRSGHKTVDTIRVEVPRDIPHGTAVLRNARLITMRGREVIEHGDIVLSSSRIVEIGATGLVHVPVGAVILDLSGKTILPGWVDVHHHVFTQWSRFLEQPWVHLIDLSFGVTAVRDPENPIQMVTYGDRGDAGELLAPRLYTTGQSVEVGMTPLGMNQPFNSAEEAQKRLAYFAANKTETSKQALMGQAAVLPDVSRRLQQDYIAAARMLRLTPTVHEVEFREDMTLMIDGYAGHEHTYPVGSVYSDVVGLSAASNLTYTQTLGIQFGFSSFIRDRQVCSDIRIARFIPAGGADAFVSLAWEERDQHGVSVMARQGAVIARGGGRVAMGSHGDLSGPGVHWEMWAMASGGMSNWEVLHAATIGGAYALGHESDFGSLEPGKLADLQVLDEDPLVDIHNTWTTHYVMKNGRLYDASTLDEIYPNPASRPRQWWQGLPTVSLDPANRCSSA
jgi:hypothetical protein